MDISSCASVDNSRRYWKPGQEMVFSRAFGEKLYDTLGREFIDLNNGWSSTNFGHQNPDLLKALQDQAARLSLTPNMLSDARVELSDVLVRATGLDEGQVHFDSTGAGCVELAAKLALAFTGRRKILSFRGGFHGRTFAPLSITGGVDLRRIGVELPALGEALPYPVRHVDDALSTDAVIDLLKERLDDKSDVAAVIVEPALGAGGYEFADPGFLAQLRRVCSDYKILMIVDEIQMGLGRCGHTFLYEKSGITPDVVLLGKSLGGGLYPVSALIARRDVFASLDDGTHTGSFSGSPIGCALGLEIMKFLQEPGFLQTVRDRGDLFARHLEEVFSDFPGIITRFDHEGMAFGFSVGNSDKNGSLLKERLRFAMLENGLFVLGRGHLENRLCLAPSLTLAPDTMLEATEKMAKSIASLTE